MSGQVFLFVFCWNLYIPYSKCSPFLFCFCMYHMLNAIFIPPHFDIGHSKFLEWFSFAGNQKLAAIGIRVSKWIAFHGLALNVTTDLTPFNWIVPCGIQNRKVGNIKELLREVDLHTGFQKDSQLIDITFEALIQEFSEVFQLDIYHKTIPSLEFLKQIPNSPPG